jgi:hypothetical protein
MIRKMRSRGDGEQLRKMVYKICKMLMPAESDFTAFQCCNFYAKIT